MTAGVIAGAVGLVALYAVVVLALRTRPTGRLAAADQAALVRAVAPPPGMWSWAWVVAAGGIGVGVAGLALRWPHLPPGRPLPTAAYVALGALVVPLAA